MMPRYISNSCWGRVKPIAVVKGTYVVATKYTDGDPGDQFCIGFYDGSYDHYGQTRYLVVDGEGKQFRHNGFRRIKRISARRGEWMVKNLAMIETNERPL